MPNKSLQLSAGGQVYKRFDWRIGGIIIKNKQAKVCISKRIKQKSYKHKLGVVKSHETLIKLFSVGRHRFRDLAGWFIYVFSRWSLQPACNWRSGCLPTLSGCHNCRASSWHRIFTNTTYAGCGFNGAGLDSLVFVSREVCGLDMWNLFTKM